MVIKKLKNKRILITAGPTWIPIDRVRVISNIATGETGVLLAQRLLKEGARVTLLLGPQGTCCLDKRIKLKAYRFFDELKGLLSKELKLKKYDTVIHTAAVSDYRPLKKYSGKVKSGIKHWRLDLVPTEKIIDMIKKISPAVFLVGFKFQAQAGHKALIDKAKNLMRRSKLDLTVSNSINKNKYQAYILDRADTYGPFRDKRGLVNKLVSVVGEAL